MRKEIRGEFEAVDWALSGALCSKVGIHGFLGMNGVLCILGRREGGETDRKAGVKRMAG